MRIEHSELLTEFISVWFETKIDGVLKFETFLDLTDRTWQTSRPDDDSVLIAGKWDRTIPDKELVKHISLHLENALSAGWLS